MAKLSAHGNRRMQLTITESRADHLKDSDGEQRVLERTTHYGFMEDGHILRKDSVVFPPGPYDNGKSRRHDWGWKLWKRIKRDGRNVTESQDNVLRILSDSATRQGKIVTVK